MGARYSEEEVAWLRENYRFGSVAESIDAFEREFGRRPRMSGFVSKVSGLGLKKDSTLAHVAWTANEIEWFRSFAPGHTEPEISAEHERVFGRPLTEGQIGNAKTRFHVKSGTQGGRFQKGNVPHNKGRSWDEQGLSAESRANSLKTCFKKGEVHGPEGHVKPIGYERVDAKDGYVWVKVKDTPQGNAPGSFNDNFRPKHHMVWEEANGRPVPEGTMIVFADRDKRNFDPENLVAVPRPIWAVISRDRMPYSDAASLRACMNVARLKIALSEKQRGERACRACGRTFKPRYVRQRTCDPCLDLRRKQGIR